MLVGKLNSVLTSMPRSIINAFNPWPATQAGLAYSPNFRFRPVHDYPEDLEQAQQVYKYFGDIFFNTSQIIALYRQQPTLFEKTKNVKMERLVSLKFRTQQFRRTSKIEQSRIGPHPCRRLPEHRHFSGKTTLRKQSTHFHQNIAQSEKQLKNIEHKFGRNHSIFI